MTRIKFCGLTRPADATEAINLGASYVGVIFAESPRRVDPARALEVLEPTRGAAASVGVFGRDEPARIADVARAARLDVVQLHGDAAPDDVAAVRALFDGPVWAALRVRDGALGEGAQPLADAADAIVLDAFHRVALGGTGQVLPWERLAPSLVAFRGRRASLVLAGGLRPANVARAVAVLAPDIVDVSSGVESEPGIKDHHLMRAFVEAVRAAAVPRS